MNSLTKAAFLFVALMLLLTRMSEAAAPLAVDAVKTGPVWCLDFSPDSSLLAAAAGERGSRGVVQIWNTRDWKSSISLPEPQAVTCVGFSPDGKSLAFGTQKGEFALFDISEKKIVARWPSGKWSVYGVTWTNDSKKIIGACANGLINVWDAQTRELLMGFDLWKADGIQDPGLRSHADRNQWDVAVSADGKTLLAGCWNDTTRLWSLENGQLIHAFPNDDRSTQGVNFMPDEKHFVTAGLGTGCVRIRETKSFRQRLTLPVAGRDLAVHPYGHLIAACSPDEVWIYDVNLSGLTDDETARVRKLIEELGAGDSKTRTDAVASLLRMGMRIEPLLYEAMNSKTEKHQDRIRIVREQLKAPKEVAVLGGLTGEVRQVVFAPSGQLLASSTTTGEVHVWSVPEFTPLQKFVIEVPEPAIAK